MNKKILIRIFFVGEIVFFLHMYLFSPEGLAALCVKKEENRQCTFRIETLSKEIKKLEDETLRWEQDSFYQEKVAREQLQMARPTDEVYYVS